MCACRLSVILKPCSTVSLVEILIVFEWARCPPIDLQMLEDGTRLGGCCFLALVGSVFSDGQHDIEPMHIPRSEVTASRHEGL